MTRRPRILVAIELGTGTQRDVITGFMQYAEQYTSWRYVPLWHNRWSAYDPDDLPEVDGLITADGDLPVAAQLAALGKPVVGLWSVPEGPLTARVLLDNAAAGEAAFKHVLGLGFQSFASISVGHAHNTLEERHIGFVAAAQKAGHPCQTHVIDARFLKQDIDDLRSLTDLWTPWIRQLKYPIAIFSPRLALARTLAFSCDALGVLVPEQVAIVAGGGDELLQRLSNPPITTVDVNMERWGFESAQRLDDLLHGRVPPSDLPRIPPKGIILRKSTDTLAIPHPVVAKAMRIIRDEACSPLSVAALSKRLPLGKRALEDLFKRLIGRTLRQEIQRVRLEHANMLLAHTDLSITEVAERCGYSHMSRFCHAFHRYSGQTAMAYREQHTATKTTLRPARHGLRKGVRRAAPAKLAEPGPRQAPGRRATKTRHR